MASNINPYNIDTTYPIAGQDNDTQGFRTNYQSIQNNFVTAQAEITAIQSNIAAVQTTFLPTYTGVLTAGNIATTNGIFWANGTNYASTISTPGNISVGNVNANGIVANVFYSNSPFGSVGLNTNPINTFIGNTLTLFNNASIYGTMSVGQPLSITALNANIQFGSNVNNYSQVNSQNKNWGNMASTDYVATPNNAASDSDTYIDMGINGSGYVGTGSYTASYANDGYLYVQGNTTTGGGNLMLATMNSANKIFLAVGGQTQANVAVTISSTAVTLTSAIQFANLTTTQITAITSPTRGMTVYNYTTGNIQVYNGTKWANVTLS